MKISPCFQRFLPESACNHVQTKETVPLLLAAGTQTEIDGQPSTFMAELLVTTAGLEPHVSL